MIIQRKPSWRFLFTILAILFSGCKPTLNDIAKEFSDQLNIPVVVLAKEDDRCALLQGNQLFTEFQNLSRAGKEKFKSDFEHVKELNHYGRILFASTQLTGKMEGDIHFFELWRWIDTGPHYHPIPNDHLVSKKLIGDESKLIDGSYPETTIYKASILQISPHAASWIGRVFVYYTYESDLYSSIQTQNDPALLQGISDHKIFVKLDAVTSKNPEMYCGKLAKLQDLL